MKNKKEKKMNLTDFIRGYSEYYGITIKDSTTICSTTFEYLKKVLYEDKLDITINGFGAFKQFKSALKKVRHPRTGEMTYTPERDIVKFKQSELYIKEMDSKNNEKE